MVTDKKGLSPNLLLFAFAFFAFFIVVFLGIWMFGITTLDSTFSKIDIQIGAVSFNDTYNQTMRPSLQVAQEQADSLGLVLLFGMIIVMILIGFFTKGNKMWVVYDVIIIVIAFFLAVQLSIGFNDYLSSSEEMNQIHADLLPKTSGLLLDLPYLIVIVGALVGIVTYGIKRKRKQEPNVFGQF